VNCTEPSSLHVRINAAAETREMWGAVPGDDGAEIFAIRADRVGTGAEGDGATSSEEAGGRGPRFAGKL